MKQVYLFIMAAILPALVNLTASAQTFKYAVVDMADGSQTFLALEQGMTTEFSSELVSFISQDGTSVDIEKADFVSISFAEASGVENPQADNIVPELTAGGVSFSGLPQGSTVNVFDTDGRLVHRADASGSATISIDSLAPGVYIVNVNGISYKICVK